MYGRTGRNSTNSQAQAPPAPPPWLVRAEVTIRHGTPVTSDSGQEPRGTTSTLADSSGLRMVYRWNTTTNDQPTPPPRYTMVPSTLITPTPSSVSSTSTQPSAISIAPAANSYGFQRGNIFFTSSPPSRYQQQGSYTIPRSGSSGNDDSIASTTREGSRVTDSGYNSEQFTPQGYSSLPTRRPSQQQLNRRCKSTCNIVLSTAGVDRRFEAINNRSPLDKPQSPQAKEPVKFSSVDPWSHRPTVYQQQHLLARSPFSTVPEVCEDCAEGSSSSPFTTHFCTRVPERTAAARAAFFAASKDAASQTTDVESRGSGASTVSKNSRVRKKSSTGARQSDTEQSRKKDNKSPTTGTTTTSPTAPSTADTERSDSSAKEDSSKKKSRTVHIDVYCTGSDDEGSTDSSGEGDERDTPMTVFENEDVRVTHTTAAGNNLPRGFQDERAFLKRSAERNCDAFKNAPMRMPSLASSKGYESDDVLSSLYPSQFSSYSALRDLDSAAWSAASSSTAIPLDYDSAAATSSKDTVSDMESLLNSRTSLTPCDSFEYANTADRERIRRMEAIWAKAEAERSKEKTWRSPQIERKQLLRNRKMREYLERHDIGWSSGDSAGESDESATAGWSFVSSEDNSRIEKNDPPGGARGASKASAETPLAKVVMSPEVQSKAVQEDHSDSTTRSDYLPHSHLLRDQIGPFGSKSPSPLPSKVPSRVTSPFTTPGGERTDHIVKASIFGAVVRAFRKPGHHIGPSKNPSCSCEHCIRYFEEYAPRGRSRSLGEFERRPGNYFHADRGIIRPAPTKPKH